MDSETLLGRLLSQAFLANDQEFRTQGAVTQGLSLEETSTLETGKAQGGACGAATGIPASQR